MIIRSPRPTRNFTIVSNSVLNDPRLSFRAMGVLVYILSKPDNWRTSVYQLSKSRLAVDSGTVRGSGAKAIRAALSELIDAGYVRSERLHRENGEWTFRYCVTDRPSVFREPWPDDEEPVTNPVDKDDSYPLPHDRKGHHLKGHINKELNLQSTPLSLTVNTSSTVKLCFTCHGNAKIITDDQPTTCPTCNGAGILRTPQ